MPCSRNASMARHAIFSFRPALLNGDEGVHERPDAGYLTVTPGAFNESTQKSPGTVSGTGASVGRSGAAVTP